MTTNIFPIQVSKEFPIPCSIWPDMHGILKDPKINEFNNDLNSWRSFWALAVKFPLISVDTETSGLRPFHGSRIVGVSAAVWDPKGPMIHVGYWNFKHAGHAKHPWCSTHGPRKKGCPACAKGLCLGYKEQAPVLPIKALQDMHPAYEKCIIAGQNFKYDIKMGSVDGLPIPNRVLDTMLIAHLWDENKRGYHLDGLAKEMGEEKLGDTIKAYMDDHQLKVVDTGHAQVPYEVERPYAIRDTVLVLKRLQWERERWREANDPKLMEVFQVENGSVPSFSSMEVDGLALDTPFIKKGIARMDAELSEISRDIYKEAGKEFDILSTDQLWLILEARGLKPISVTPTGKPSLDDVALQAYNDPFTNLIKGYRARYKMCNTYFKPFLEHVDENNLMHAEFFIHGTVGGRASCREPNLQNIPRFEKFGSRTKMGTVAKSLQSGLKTEEIKDESTLETRRCFVPRSRDHSLFFFDYAQMELRVFADYAEEKFLIDTLARGGDLHEATARKIFPSFPDKDKDPKLYEYFRQLTKQINFGIIYGMGRNKLAVQLNVPVDEIVRALELLLRAHETIPGLAQRSSDLSVERCKEILEDHRIMTGSRQWDGLRRLSTEIKHKIITEVLEKELLKDGNNMRLMYSAERFLSNYHAQFPNIKRFTKQIQSTIETRGYIFNRYGRRYHLSADKGYVGVNRLVQGTCADMVKIAQYRVEKLLKDKKTRMIGQVHDELQFDIHHEELHLIPEIKHNMEVFDAIKVNMQVDIDYSHISWANKREWVDETEFNKALEDLRGPVRGKSKIISKPIKKSSRALARG